MIDIIGNEKLKKSASDFLNHEELISLTAIVEYLEYKKVLQAKAAYSRLTSEFEVSELKEIKRSDYDRAIQFLIDLGQQKLN